MNVHFTFAIILPLDVPDPSSKVTFAIDGATGSIFPTPIRGDNVRFDPAALLYTIKIFAFVISEPWPSPILIIELLFVYVDVSGVEKPAGSQYMP